MPIKPTERDPIDRLLPGRVVADAHLSRSHGGVLFIDFKDGTQLVVWAFDDPEDLQLVLWNHRTEEILVDERTQSCRQFTEATFRKLARRGISHDTPFKAYCTSFPVAD